jgi:3-hydroxyacyl-[acyl-carrier-protein] dehydratase
MMAKEGDGALDINGIMRYLPHRYPFLLVDRVLVCEPGRTLRAVKNVTMNEPFFAGHFPGHPVMPGVLVIEALAQAAAILAHRTLGTASETIFLFAAIDNARFRRQVVPGDQLRLEIDAIRIKPTIAKFLTRALVGDDVAAEAELMAVLRRPGAGEPGAAG